jgi:hypothetical protein
MYHGYKISGNINYISFVIKRREVAIMKLYYDICLAYTS